MGRARSIGAEGGRPLWEYEEEFLRHDAEWAKTLNTYGKRGWELVALIHDESESEPLQVRAVFKRVVAESDVRSAPSDDDEEG